MRAIYHFLCQAIVWIILSTAVHATPFTMTVPITNVALPPQYPQAGGVAIVMTGVNGNIYYQFSDPTGAFVGFQNTGTPTAFRGNPFTVNSPIALDCGFRSCTDYFGGAIRRIDLRFSAYDGDTQVGGFDFNDIRLYMNGFNVGSWSRELTDITNDAGTVSFGTEIGFGNNTFNTGWFSSTDAALLSNILTTGATTTQVYDNDPNDNYWDFTRGNKLADPALRTIAPGYEFEKTSDRPLDRYSAVGDVVNYTYVVRNIGSVRINNISVIDDKLGTITCNPTSIDKTAKGGTPKESICTAQYIITQADIDRGSLTNIARANGTPEFGQLGEVRDSVTLTGPPKTPNVTITKTPSPTTFSTVGQVITYDFVIRNTGNVTLSNVQVTDPKIPGLVCSFAGIAPLSATNTNITRTCRGTYTVTQADIDASAAGTPLLNTASLTARDPDNGVLSRTANASVTGPASAPAMTVVKTAAQSTFTKVGDVITYSIRVTNTGNVTWPNGPTITDALTSNETCPTAPVAPKSFATCTASYTVTQADLNAGKVDNTATASVTVSGATAQASGSASVPATVTTGITVDKTLQAGSPNPIVSDTNTLVYEYLVTNTGTVSIKDIVLVDNKIGLTCPATTLEPKATMICTSATYDVTPADMTAGSVTNTVTANANTTLNAPLTAATDSLTVPVLQQPAMTMDKTAPTVAPADFRPGLAVLYSYAVTNTGNVSIPAPIQIFDNKFAQALNCSTAPLAVGATVTCSQQYTVRAADVNAGEVTNVAYAQQGTTVSPTDSVTIPQAGSAAITLTKTPLTASYNAVGQTIDYSFTVTNTGEVNIVDTQVISISDAKIASISCAQPAVTYAPASGLSPQSFTCTGTYGPVTQADIDANKVDNSARASFVRNTTAGPVTVQSNVAQASTPADITPDFTFTKTPVSTPARFTAVGQVVSYRFEITNLTSQTLASAVVTDPKIPTLSCSFTNIAPFGVVSCTGSYTITQADMDAETVLNTAKAVGTAPGGEVITKFDDATYILPPAAINRALTLDKQATPATFTTVGQEINYAFLVTNTGNQTLSDIVVNDAALGIVNCIVPPLAPTQSNSSCSGSYTIAQTDIDNGSYANTANASATGVAAVPDTATVTGPAENFAFDFSKVADGPFVKKDDVVNFTLAVQNTGNVTLYNVVIEDTFFAPTLTCTVATIAPGTTDRSCVAAYTVTQADVDAGEITNTASVTAENINGVSDTKSATAVVPGPAENVALSVDKIEVAADGKFGAVGTTETFDFVITNTGNVTLTGLQFADPMLSLSCALPDLAPLQTTSVCLGGAPLQTSYTVTQDDVDRGGITNVATVNGASTQGTTVAAQDEVTLAGPRQLPAISMVKSSTGGANFTAVGDIVSYNYVVQNTGNITLTSRITVTDDKTTVTCPALTGGRLEIGASLTCTSTYRVTQADLDAGQVTNTATAGVTQPVVPSVDEPGVTDPSYPNGIAVITSAPDSATVPATQLPALSVAKSIKTGTPSTYDATSDVITYTFVVRNAGNVTTTAPITINDLDIPTSFTCTTATLAPGATATCEATWTPTQADIDSGSFTNRATAATVFNGSPVTAPEDTATAYAVRKPAMTLDKSFTSITGGVFAENEVITYTYLITNTGNQTIIAPITVDDNLIGTFTCGAVDLAPTQTATCTNTYTVTLADLQIGSVTNVATAVSPTVSSPPTSETVPTTAEPGLSITKAADVATFSAVGEKITYTYVVTNTSQGDPTATPPILPPAIVADIFVADDKIAAPILCFTSTTAEPSLRPGFSSTCTADYFVTQPDLDAVKEGLTTGFVTNNANAVSEYAGSEIVSPPQTVTVAGVANPQLVVTKSSTGPNPAAVNDVLTFTIRVANTGNQTISGIEVVDPMLTGLTCRVDGALAPANLVLTPTEFAICRGTYQVTQADVDAQTLRNTATATGANPQGEIVTDDGSTTHPIVPDQPAVTVLKSLSEGEPATAFSAVGQMIEFTITVTNSGNVTLNSTRVTDILFPGQERLITTPLAPGESDSSAKFVYEVTQADIDRGTLFNRATAEAIPNTPTAAPVSGSDALTGTGPDREPRLSMVKTADVATFDAKGDPIVYNFTVANTGNITITDQPTIDDPKIANVVCEDIAATGMAPGDFITCSATYLVTQEDVDAGVVTNVATVSAADPVTPGNVLSAIGSVTVDGVRTPGYTLVKSADDTTDVVAGQLITYSYRVENTGNVTLTDLTLSDAHTSAAGTNALTLSNGGIIATIAPNEVVTLTASYAVTQADIDALNPISNIVTSAATAPSGVTPLDDKTDTLSVTVAAPAPALTVDKTASITADAQVDDVIDYSYLVTNTGNLTLTAITLADTHTSAAGALPLTLSDGGIIAELVPGASATLTASYSVTQADIDAGVALTNTVTADATAPAGVAAPDQATDTVNVGVAVADPTLEVIKTIAPPAALVPNAEVTYTITVANTGNVSLRTVSLLDTLLRNTNEPVTIQPIPVYDSGDAGTAGVLEVGETWTYLATYRLTQDDIDAGGIKNSARATAVPPVGLPVSDVSDTGTGTGSTPTPLTIPANPGIEGVKTITSTALTLGSTVRFEITATNTGNVTLTNVAVASDTLTRADSTPLVLTTAPEFFVADQGSVEGTLKVGETATYRATYVLTQADIDAGGIANAAVVAGKPPVGSPVTDATDNGDDTDGETATEPTVLVIPAVPSLALVKTLVSGGPTFDAVGDTLTYAFVVTNTGNATITDPITVSDPLIEAAGGAVTCPTGPVAPLASITCSGSYAVTQADLDAGEVVNTATAQTGGVTSAPSTEIVPALQSPALSTVKTAVSIAVDGATYTDLLAIYFRTGAVVTYDYLVTNTGNQTLTAPITVSDNLISTVTCPAMPAGRLAPTATLTCTATYTVTADDVVLTSVTNVASATSGTVTSPLVTETVPADGRPSLATVKTLISVQNPDSSNQGSLAFDQVGDVLTYRFDVTNSGTQAFAAPVTITDTIIVGPITCYTPDASNPDFVPGETISCEASYTVTQADLDAGEVFNEAFAGTIFGADATPVISDVATQTTPVAATPAITIVKSAATLPITGAGQTLTYTLTLTNTGNQTLTSIVGRDPKLADLDCRVASLAPLASTSCTGTYVVTQADVDAGSLSNTASVSAITPAGGSVGNTDTLVLDVPAPAPAMVLTKTALPTPFGPVGSSITYVLAVENTGNVTLTNVQVTDALVTPAFTCTIARLDVGATDNSCAMRYTVTQADKDAGEITNTASATAQDPFGTNISATDTITTPAVTARPALIVTKTAMLSGTLEGSIVTFDLLVANTGDVTLTVDPATDIADTMQRAGGGVITLTTPFAYVRGDADLDGKIGVGETFVYRATYRLTLDDINAGGIENTVTVTAADPFNTDVSDVSDDGDDTDGNTTDDPTVVPITQGPALDVVKVVKSAGSVAGDAVVFAITATNTGNVALSNVTITDTLTRVDDTDITVDIVSIVQTAPVAGVMSIAPGESYAWDVTYVLTQADVDAGGISNTATAAGVSPDNVPVFDVSDNGNDTDGNLTDDPTTVRVTGAPGFDVVKTVQPRANPDAPVIAGEEVVFDVAVNNTGNVTISGLALVDTMTNYAGDVLAPVTVTFVSGNAADVVGANSSNIYRVSYVLTQADIDAGGVRNTVSITGQTPGGDPIADVSDDGDDTDGNVFDDPTEVPIAALNMMDVTKTAGTPERLSGNTFAVTFTMTATNTGNTTARGIKMRDDLAAFVAPATLVGTTAPVATGFAGTGGGNPAYNGTSDTALLTAGVELAPGDMGMVEITVTYDVANGSPGRANVVNLSNDAMEGALLAEVGLPDTLPPRIVATKTVTPDDAQLGATVTYTLTFENQLATIETGLTIVDDLPVGIAFTPGTALLNGAATPEPVLIGRSLRWENLTMAPQSTITVTLQARVTGSMGEITNRAYMLGPDGSVVSNVATATITRRPEAVFDCADIIGRVFDDRNMNGYQDGVPEIDRSAITDQDIFDGKLGGKATPIPEDPSAEKGLPNVRLATVNGTIITTDEYGRFSVPCAELPAAGIGSNFTLKLDDRSLPTGYRVTTENPRVVRVTAGTVAKLNFGAAIANVVDIDLVASAFVAGTVTPSVALIAGVDQLIAYLNQQPSVLRLSYYMNGEGRETARARLDAVEEMIRDRWQDAGVYRLLIERTIQQLQ